MEIIETPVSNLRPDPKQPRQTIDTHLIEEMSFTLKGKQKTGTAPRMINPIEVDKTYTIVTGEMRWRAAQLAGLNTVPVKVVDPGDEGDRFLRQLKENIHRGTMTTWDLANAFAKMINFVPGTKLQGRDSGISELARNLGKPETYIREHLNLLEESTEIRKALKEEKVDRTYIRDASKAPKEYRKPLKKRIVKGEFSSREGMVSLAKALKQRPDKAEELWKKDYQGMSGEQVIRTVQDIAPTPFEQIDKATDKASKLINLVTNLTEGLDKTELKNIPPLMRVKLATSLTALVEKINHFVRTSPNNKLLKEAE